jgi:hypothetical protein
MAESAFSRVASIEIAGTTPPGVQPHTVLTGNVFMKSLFMATATDLGVNDSVTVNNGLVICSMTSGTVQFCCMCAFLPLSHCSRRLLFVALNAIISAGSCCHNKDQAKQAKQANKTIH